MRVLDLEQKTDEWLEWRKQKCTASEAPVIMGKAAYYSDVQTWDDLRLSKEGYGAEPGEFTKKAWAHGERVEPIARDHVMPTYVPVCGEWEEDDRFAASLDGYEYIPDIGTSWAEIKCPYVGVKSSLLKQLQLTSPDLPNKQRIPDHVWWQMVHQAGVIGDPEAMCSLLVFVIADNPEEAETQFVYQLLTVPATELLADWPALHARWLEYLAGEEQNRTDFPWQQAAADWVSYSDAEKAAKKQKESARKKLIELCGPDGEGRGAGVSVRRVPRKGTIDWHAVADGIYEGDDLDDMAEAFRREDTMVPTVRAVKE